MLNSQNKKLEAIDQNTLIVGIDVAKKIQWARFIDFRGIDILKSALRIDNNINGFKSLLEKINQLQNEEGYTSVIVGMEPTGHYFKPLANFLNLAGIKAVMVNPYHTKRAKELDDNSQTKNDQKDALTIARLIRDGRYLELYLPQDEYADLRSLSNTRIEINRQLNGVKNRIRAIMDEYFPEFEQIFKSFIKGKAALHLLNNYPFPSDIKKLGYEGVLEELKKATKKTVGKKKAWQIFKAAIESIGVEYGLTGTRIKLKTILDEYTLLNKRLKEIETEMEKALERTGLKEILLSIPCIGIVTAASILGEIGDPKRFTNANQICRLAGYNLIENSSGQSKGKTSISKRGRANLRGIMYQVAMLMVAKNKEMKALYQYLKTRKENPLKGKQALVVIAKKVIKIIFALIKKQEMYQSSLVLGEYRLNQIKVA